MKFLFIIIAYIVTLFTPALAQDGKFKGENSDSQKCKGMLQAKHLKLINEKPVGLGKHDFKLRLIINNYSINKLLVAKVSNTNNITVDIYSRLPKGGELKKILMASLKEDDEIVQNIMKNLKHPHLVYLSELDNSYRDLTPWSESMHTLEYFIEGKYNVIDFPDLKEDTFTRLGKGEEEQKRWAKMVRSLRTYKETINLILQVALVKEIK